LKKARERKRTAVPLFLLTYLCGGRRGRRSDKGIICDGASSPPADSARSPTMSTWGSGRDIDGDGRVWPHHRPVPWVGDGLGGYCQHSGIEGSHPPGKVRGGRRTARPLPRERIVRTNLPGGPYARPGWIRHGPLAAARKGPFPSRRRHPPCRKSLPCGRHPPPRII